MRILRKDKLLHLQSVLTNMIYADELKEVYVQKDIAYKDVTEAARAAMRRIIDQLESVENPPESIQKKLLELALELRTVSGKKQYGYLKKPLKDKVDSIVEELEKLPRVAAYYAVWNDLRDTLESYYKKQAQAAQFAIPAKRVPRHQERHHSGSGAFVPSTRRIFCTGFCKSDACK